jgi:hypothetical protein
MPLASEGRWNYARPSSESRSRRVPPPWDTPRWADVPWPPGMASKGGQELSAGPSQDIPRLDVRSGVAAEHQADAVELRTVVHADDSYDVLTAVATVDGELVAEHDRASGDAPCRDWPTPALNDPETIHNELAHQPTLHVRSSPTEEGPGSHRPSMRCGEADRGLSRSTPSFYDGATTDEGGSRARGPWNKRRCADVPRAGRRSLNGHPDGVPTARERTARRPGQGSEGEHHTSLSALPPPATRTPPSESSAVCHANGSRLGRGRLPISGVLLRRSPDVASGAAQSPGGRRAPALRR